MIDFGSAYAAFHDYFEVVPATSEALLQEVFKLRYQVYCEELHYEEAERFPDKMEIDEYDRYSCHCLLRHRAAHAFAGCVRLILGKRLPVEARFPLQKICGDVVLPTTNHAGRHAVACYGEISRLAVHSNFRKRRGEAHTPFGLISTERPAFEPNRRRFPHLALGLCLIAASMGINNGLDAVFVLMEPRLARLLKLYGLHFQQVGASVQFNGVRAPFRITKSVLYKRLSPPMCRLLNDLMRDVAALPG